MIRLPGRYRLLLFCLALNLFFINNIFAQKSVLLNGDFEDINTCSEYDSECGVEGWFYLKEVKAQMLSNDSNIAGLGNNSYLIYYKWLDYTGFTPIIGSLLPCALRPGVNYTFSGMIAATVGSNMMLKPGFAIAEKYFVPRRPFSKEIAPVTITNLKKIEGSAFYSFEYSFTAEGGERYLTFGTYIFEDSSAGKKARIGTQTVSMTLDNFSLYATDDPEDPCPDFHRNKELIYAYNSRHKEMDYSLYGKGELSIDLPINSPGSLMQPAAPTVTLVPDTLDLGDVFFDFNKSALTSPAVKMLETFFLQGDNNLDSIKVEGHADSIGSDQSNLALSEARCNSVKNWLVNSDVLEAGKIKVIGFGRSRPVATNSTSAGRALNRRVQLIIYRHRPIIQN